MKVDRNISQLVFNYHQKLAGTLLMLSYPSKSLPEPYSYWTTHRKVGRNITRIKLPNEKSAETIIVLNYP
jgi:hypothetical protein